MNRVVTMFLIFILAIATFLRLWDLREIPPGLYHDEAMNVNQALEAWREGDFKIFYPENNGREGLFINIQALSLAAFGAVPFAARLPSAIFGILTVLGVFFLTKELIHEIPNTKFPISNKNKNSKIGNWKLEIGNYKVALFASFLLATSFWHINFSRIGFRAIMAPFFLVWSMYFLWMSLRGASDSERRGNPFENNEIASSATPPRNGMIRHTLSATIGGFLFGLGFHSYIAYRVAPLLLIIPFFVGRQTYKTSKLQITNYKLPCAPCLLALFLFFAFIAALPLGLYFLENPADFVGRSSQVSIFSSETPLYDFSKNILTAISMFFRHGDYNWRHNFSGSSQLWWPVSLLFLIGFIVSIRDLVKNSKLKTQNYNSKFKILHFTIFTLRSFFPTIHGFLFIWFFVFFLPVVLSNEGLPHALRALPLVIPAVIFAALGLKWIIEKTTRWLNRQRVNAPEKSTQLNRVRGELVVLLFIFLFAIAAHGFNQYFLRWSWNPHVYGAFNGSYADLGRYLATLPDTTKKYVIVNTPGHMLIDNIPMPAQTIMFFTDTWNAEIRRKKNILYVPSVHDLFLIPEHLESPVVIAMLENDFQLRRELKTRYPELTSKIIEGGLILTNVQ